MAPLADIEIQKIHNGTEPDAVHKVAHGSAEHHAKPPEQQLFAALRRAREHENHARRNQRSREEQPKLPFDVRPVEEPERGPAIADIHQIKEAGDDRHRPIIGQ